MTLASVLGLRLRPRWRAARVSCLMMCFRSHIAEDVGARASVSLKDLCAQFAYGRQSLAKRCAHLKENYSSTQIGHAAWLSGIGRAHWSNNQSFNSSSLHASNTWISGWS